MTEEKRVRTVKFPLTAVAPDFTMTLSIGDRGELRYREDWSGAPEGAKAATSTVSRVMMEQLKGVGVKCEFKEEDEVAVCVMRGSSRTVLVAALWELLFQLFSFKPPAALRRYLRELIDELDELNPLRLELTAEVELPPPHRQSRRRRRRNGQGGRA